MTWEEVIKLLKISENADEINSKRYEIAEWIPQIVKMFNFDQMNNYHQYDLWLHCVHTVLGINKSIDDDMLYLAALLHDIGKIYSQSNGKRPDDVNCHYYGHPEKSVQIVKDIIYSLSINGVEFSEEDEERLLYYVKYHDDRVSLREKHLKRHLKMVDVETFKKLMELQVADAKAHVISPLIQQRIDICSEWKNGRADEIKERLDEKQEVEYLYERMDKGKDLEKENSNKVIHINYEELPRDFFEHIIYYEKIYPSGLLDVPDQMSMISDRGKRYKIYSGEIREGYYDRIIPFLKPMIMIKEKIHFISSNAPLDWAYYYYFHHGCIMKQEVYDKFASSISEIEKILRNVDVTRMNFWKKEIERNLEEHYGINIERGPVTIIHIGN